MRLLASASALAVVALGASPAFAAGTTAGTTVTNTVTLNYSVGGVGQTAITDDDQFVVDRKINLTVAEVGTTTTTVSPGQADAITAFTVTNTSNAVLDFALSSAQQTGGAGAHSNTDNFDVSGVAIFVDVNNNGTYESATDTATFIDELAADASKTVFILGDVALARVTGDVAAVTLTATARESGTAGSQGAAVTQTAGANTAGVDTVFADLAGATDAARDAAHSAKDDYTVLAANLSVTKTSSVISDPFNGTTNPKMIPGAVVEYCIAISNAAGGATATNVSITDPIPANTTYSAGFGILVGATISGGTCNADGAAGGSFGSGQVTANIGNVTAGSSTGIRFRVTVD
jgi:uncharacterized repeat protein (TIGR01451 family)